MINMQFDVLWRLLPSIAHVQIHLHIIFTRHFLFSPLQTSWISLPQFYWIKCKLYAAQSVNIATSWRFWCDNVVVILPQWSEATRHHKKLVKFPSRERGVSICILMAGVWLVVYKVVFFVWILIRRVMIFHRKIRCEFLGRCFTPYFCS